MASLRCSSTTCSSIAANDDDSQQEVRFKSTLAARAAALEAAAVAVKQEEDPPPGYEVIGVSCWIYLQDKDGNGDDSSSLSLVPAHRGKVMGYNDDDGTHCIGFKNSVDKLWINIQAMKKAYQFSWTEPDASKCPEGLAPAPVKMEVVEVQEEYDTSTDFFTTTAVTATTETSNKRQQPTAEDDSSHDNGDDDNNNNNNNQSNKKRKSHDSTHRSSSTPASTSSLLSSSNSSSNNNIIQNNNTNNNNNNTSIVQQGGVTRQQENVRDSATTTGTKTSTNPTLGILNLLMDHGNDMEIVIKPPPRAVAAAGAYKLGVKCYQVVKGKKVKGLLFYSYNTNTCHIAENLTNAFNGTCGAVAVLEYTCHVEFMKQLMECHSKNHTFRFKVRALPKSVEQQHQFQLELLLQSQKSRQSAVIHQGHIGMPPALRNRTNDPTPRATTTTTTTTKMQQPQRKVSLAAVHHHQHQQDETNAGLLPTSSHNLHHAQTQEHERTKKDDDGDVRNGRDDSAIADAANEDVVMEEISGHGQEDEEVAPDDDAPFAITVAATAAGPFVAAAGKNMGGTGDTAPVILHHERGGSDGNEDQDNGLDLQNNDDQEDNVTAGLCDNNDEKGVDHVALNQRRRQKQHRTTTTREMEQVPSAMQDSSLSTAASADVVRTKPRTAAMHKDGCASNPIDLATPPRKRKNKNKHRKKRAASVPRLNNRRNRSSSDSNPSSPKGSNSDDSDAAQVDEDYNNSKCKNHGRSRSSKSNDEDNNDDDGDDLNGPNHFPSAKKESSINVRNSRRKPARLPSTGQGEDDDDDDDDDSDSSDSSTSDEIDQNDEADADATASSTDDSRSDNEPDDSTVSSGSTTEDDETTLDDFYDWIVDKDKGKGLDIEEEKIAGKLARDAYVEVLNAKDKDVARILKRHDKALKHIIDRYHGYLLLNKNQRKQLKPKLYPPGPTKLKKEQARLRPRQFSTKCNSGTLLVCGCYGYSRNGEKNCKKAYVPTSEANVLQKRGEHESKKDFGKRKKYLDPESDQGISTGQRNDFRDHCGKMKIPPQLFQESYEYAYAKWETFVKRFATAKKNA